MNRNEFETNWNQLRGAITAKWSKFTPEDVSKLDGKYDPFLAQLQKRYGYSREQVEMEMKNWNLSSIPQGKKIESIAPCDASCKDTKAHPKQDNRPGQNDRRDQNEKKRKTG